MKKLVLIFILLSSTSLWSEDDFRFYDCFNVEDDKEFATISMIGPLERGRPIFLNTLRMKITRVGDTVVYFEKKDEKGRLVVNASIYQALSMLNVATYRFDGTTISTSKNYNCKFRM
ncbi:hypothetical protein OA512_01525 [SAR86 cluster bacterium]|nr:hypothetical protein [SAR86 cluster bacterium]